ncbi:MAG: glycosyltransferase family 2 protein [Elusimicrobiota bacterium]
MSGKLSIIIPAYNEEGAIADILTRCLAARAPICAATGLAAVEVLVVDDGSRDKTRGIAGGFSEAKLISHPVNRGYGAALMTGFSAASGDYLSFLDADGTCDPLAFIDLYKALEREKADMSVGNRMHSASQMPRVRHFGNRIYAALISVLSGVRVEDSASGMRVFSRSLLPRLAPLPSGLHFTPAMTARVACMGKRIVETPIPYAERQGRSKLSVFRDGLRFFRVILGIIFAYFPLRVFGPIGLLFLATALAYAYAPVSFYLENHRLHEDVIYRLVTITTLCVCGLMALVFGLLGQKVSNISVRRARGFIDTAWLREGSILSGAVLAVAGVLLNSRTIVEYISSGRITTHWVYILTGSLLVISGTLLLCMGIMLGILDHLPGTGAPAKTL